MLNKRGLSGIIVTVLIIIIVLAAISILWIYLSAYFRNQSAIAAAQTQVLTEKYEITGFQGDPSNPTLINLSINRGPAKVLVNGTITRTVQVDLPTDVVSVVSLSGSMTGIKLTKAKEANLNLIDSILSSSSTRVGIVGATPGDPNPSADVNYYLHELSNNKASLKEKVLELQTNTNLNLNICLCCAIDKALEILDIEDTSRKKVLVLITDGATFSQYNCVSKSLSSGNVNLPVLQGYIDSITSSNLDDSLKSTLTNGGFIILSNGTYLALQSLNKSYINKKVPTYSVLIEPSARNPAVTAYYMGFYGGNHFLVSTIDELESVYRTIGTEIQNTYTTERAWAYLRVVISNETDSYVDIIQNPPQTPFETKTYNLTINPTGSITNIKKIEIFPVITAENGQEVTGPAIDTYTFR